MEKLPKDLNLNINAFENMLNMKRMTNSYKLYWFAAVFEEIKKGNQELTFKELVIGMITKSWHTIVQYKLNLGSQDQSAEVVKILNNKYDIEKNNTEENLKEILNINLNDDSVIGKINNLYKYVPYRLLTPFYTD